MDKLDLSIIIVNWNVKDYLRQCLESIAAAVGNLAYEVIVVDNASTDGSVEMLRREFPWVTLIANRENVGFARGNNLGIERSCGDYLALVNPDVVLGPGSLKGLVRFLHARPDAGVVGPKILQPDGTICAYDSEFPSPASALEAVPVLARLVASWQRRHLFKVQPQYVPSCCDSVHGCCMVFRRDALEAINGIPATTFMYGEELLIGQRLKKLGYEVWYDPLSEVVHYGDASTNRRWKLSEQAIVRRVAAIVVFKEFFSAPSFWVWNLITLFGESLRLPLAPIRDQRTGVSRFSLIKLHWQALLGKDLRKLMPTR
jgi:GT2 family glycosyltransferase